MSKYLSISEVSKLLDISIHNIRYYEKEGLLETPKKTEKGYRLFSFEEIENLSAIMMLRNSEISIKEIKDLMNDYNPDKFIKYMIKSSENIEKKIEKFQKIKDDIDRMVEGNRYKTLGIYKKDIEMRKLIPIKTCKHEESITAREFYEFLNDLNLNIINIATTEVFFILDEKEITYCIQITEKTEHDKAIEISSGRYLCHKFKVTSESDFDKEADYLKKYIDENKLKVTGKLYLRELNVEAFYYNLDKELIYEYQILIEE